MSAYSPQVAGRGRPAADVAGRLHRRADLRRDASPGRRTTGWAWRRPPSSPPRATSPATSARSGIRCNLVSAGPLKTLAAKAIPGFEDLESAWKDRAPLGWDEADHDADRARPCARCSATSSRRRPARSSTSTAASTRWGSEPVTIDVRVTSLVELRVLEGPNLYFPRAAIKLTLDISGLAAASDETVRRFAAGSGCATPGRARPESGFRQRFALRAVERLVRAIATRGRHLAARGPGAADLRRPPGRRGLPVAQPRPRRRRWARPSPTCSTRCPAPTSRRRSSAAAERVAARRAGRPPDHDHPEGPGHRGDRHQRQDHDRPDDRPHRAHRRAARRLVQHRRHLHRRRAGRGRRLLRPERRRPGARAPARCSSRSPRPPAAASCSRASA